MLRIFVRFFILVLTAFVGVHASAALPGIPLTKENKESIKAIALVQVDLPVFRVSNDSANGAIGAFGGLLGAAAMIAVNDASSQTYFKNLSDKKIDLVPDLIESITQGLTLRGYHVDYLQDQKPIFDSVNKKTDYSALKTDADAIMIFKSIMLGYRSVNLVTTYSPFNMALVTLVNAKNSEDYLCKISCLWL